MGKYASQEHLVCQLFRYVSQIQLSDKLDNQMGMPYVSNLS